MEDNKQKLTDTLFKRHTATSMMQTMVSIALCSTLARRRARGTIESQTIIKEIARFGSNIFKEGALIRDVTVDNKVQFVRFSGRCRSYNIVSKPES